MRKDAPNPLEPLAGPTSPNPHTTSHPAEIPIPTFPDGVKILHDCPDATVDICFVHGLTGNRDSTWTADGQSTPWPQTLLPPRLPNARILTYGYDAYVVRKGVAGSNRLVDHATNLLHDLTADRACYNATSRPLVFVAHSMGGLVCKKAILRSRNNPATHLRGIFDATKGIIFMGTPHRGAWMADWAKIPVSVFGTVKSANMSLLDILQKDNQLLESIRIDFSGMIRELEKEGKFFEVTCFFEELPLSTFGKVVSKDSATFEGHDPITIHANHRDMVKFASAEETGFKRLLGELIRWEAQIRLSEARQPGVLPMPPWLAEDTPESSSAEAAPETRTVISSELVQRIHTDGGNQYNTFVRNPSEYVLLPLQGCLRSLAFPEMESRYYDIDFAHEETCEWLLQHKVYSSWINCNQGLLWIKGIPGSGKSTLLRYALENRKDVLRAENSALVASFFFSGRGTELQKTPLGFYRSLLHQVLSQVPDALPSLVDIFQKKRETIGEPGKDWQWHQGELEPFFESLPKILTTRSVWLFVDALDECGKETATKLLSKFKMLCQRIPATDVEFHLCVTSRHYPLPNQTFPFEIWMEHENGKDISTYVNNQLTEAGMIASMIIAKASGVFLWACLVVDMAINLQSDGREVVEIEEEIGRIPTKLHKLYQELVDKMKEERLTSIKLIQWICFATRPLSLDELRWAMVVEADGQYRSLRNCRPKLVSNNENMKRRVQKLSCGLAEVVPSSQTVQFIHQSVKDFFLETGLSVLDGKSTEATIGTAHFQLSRICIRYLAMEEISQSPTYDLDSFPFLRYATTSWIVHAKQCDDEKVPQEDMLEIFAWPSNALVEVWVRVFTAITRYSDDCPPRGTNLVHILARYGILTPLLGILHMADISYNNVNIRDENGRTPLSWASGNGYKDIVQLLLDKNAQVNAADTHNRTPLWWTAENGHRDVIQLLLDKGAQTDTPDTYGQTPLSSASRSGHKDIVQLLLDKGAQADTPDKYGRTPLSKAAENGHKDIVQLLLDKGAQADTPDKYGRTPLSRAAEIGHKDIVQLLFDKNAQTDTPNTYIQTPLSSASQSGHKDIVQLLLDKGAQADTPDKYGRTPLSGAAENGHKNIVQLLLDKGAQADTPDEDGQTPLSWAAENGHRDVIQLLLDKGAQADTPDEDGQTPLSKAAGYGHKDIVQLLLDKGARADTPNKAGQTPLSWAARNGHKDVVQLLFDKAAQADTSDDSGINVIKI